MYQIGQFAKLMDISPRMLRHYEKAGIFVPNEIDKKTGYRYYIAHQIPLLKQILLLRDSGFKVEEMAETLRKLKDASFLETILLRKRDQSRHLIQMEEQKIKKINQQLVALKEEKQMIKGTEIDFIVSDSLKALALYKKVFEIEVVEATEYPIGMNEAVFQLYGTRFHMLDANEEYGLKSPTQEHPNTIWFNITVENIEETHQLAMENGCQEVQPITEMMEGALKNSLFIDPYGYMWMLHQIYQELSFDERIEILENEL